MWSPNFVPDPSVPDHQMQYLKSDIELGVLSIPFHTCSIPVPDQAKYLAHTHLYHCGNQQASVIVPHPPDQVRDPDPPGQTA